MGNNIVKDTVVKYFAEAFDFSDMLSGKKESNGGFDFSKVAKTPEQLQKAHDKRLAGVMKYILIDENKDLYDDLCRLIEHNGPEDREMFIKKLKGRLDKYGDLTKRFPLIKIPREDADPGEDIRFTYDSTKFEKILRFLAGLPDCKGFTEAFGNYWDLSWIDVSEVRRMQWCMSSAGFMQWNRGDELTIDVSSWDTSNVTSFESCFEYACAKMVGMEKWNTRNVTNMTKMFHHARFNEMPDVSRWDVRSVKTMKGMFEGAENLRYMDFTHWNTWQCTDMSRMFANCENFQGNVSGMNTESLQQAHEMFFNCEKFDSDLSRWDVTNLKNATQMFWNCSSFDSDLSGWKTYSLTFSDGMFAECKSLTSDFTKWNVSGCHSMCKMFWKAHGINGDLNGWQTKDDVMAEEMFDGRMPKKKVPVWWMRRYGK